MNDVRSSVSAAPPVAGTRPAPSEGAECLEDADVLCEPYWSVTPESGIGVLPPQNRLEAAFNWFSTKLTVLSAILLLAIAAFITIDVCGRLFFNRPWVGITDLEMLFMSVVGFASLSIAIVQRQSIQIDLFYERFGERTQRALYLFACTVSCGAAAVIGWRAILAALEWKRDSAILEIPEWPVIMVTGVCLVLAGVAFLFQICHVLRSLLRNKEYAGLVLGLGLAVLLACLPFLYKAWGVRLSGLALGGAGFLLLMSIMLLRVPLGWAMSAIGLLGLLAITRRPEAALVTVSTIPFLYTATFIMIAFPMFMLMGEMVSLAGLSGDLFDAAKKWMGRLPGGLAVATVGGCAGFGAVCGDSMATVITMTTVAMPAMDESGYDKALSTGALAAGGTLGILIPPSMGFIIYSMITEESVGKLFMSGIIPGVVLAAIFMVIIMLRVRQHPEWAPKSPAYPLKERLVSLIFLIPVVILFLVVVIGILQGWFTPAEGGALGAVMAFAYALLRRRLTWDLFRETMYRSTAMFGKLFALFVGLYVLGAFLAVSRLPNLLADTVAGMDVNRYVILAAVIVLYIFLGCMMNIMPMMMLTLPSIYPTIQALGFDGIWFGCVCVIVMEMGMITPPVGMNVFTLAGLRPDIPMATIFRGVLPFFLGMMLCVILVIIFPQLVLFLVP